MNHQHIALSNSWRWKMQLWIIKVSSFCNFNLDIFLAIFVLLLSFLFYGALGLSCLALQQEEFKEKKKTAIISRGSTSHAQLHCHGEEMWGKLHCRKRGRKRKKKLNLLFLQTLLERWRCWTQNHFHSLHWLCLEHASLLLQMNILFSLFRFSDINI